MPQIVTESRFSGHFHIVALKFSFIRKKLQNYLSRYNDFFRLYLMTRYTNPYISYSEAYLALWAHYLELNTEHLVASHKLKKDGKDYGVSRRTDGNSKHYSEKSHPEEKDFDYYKQSLMEKYSLTMTNSLEFAKSLMETALQNFTNNMKFDSIPLQYDVLKRMNYATYNNHFQQFNGNNVINSKKPIANIIQDSPKFIIDSINSDESTTVTLVFLQQRKVTDPNWKDLLDYFETKLTHKLFKSLYTRTSEHTEFSNVKGILLTLVSVEGKDKQSGKEILELLGDDMHKEVVAKFGANSGVGNLWNHMKNQRITIQTPTNLTTERQAYRSTHIDTASVYVVFVVVVDV
ncbi:hypothetical protein HA402_001393 [Bradysia odoriphaga]|nr:hypothetical protein HA402_001393 [Bradysia odoriphaga]